MSSAVTLRYMRLAILMLAMLLAGCSQSDSSSPIDNCPQGFDDCNGDPDDGCETDLTTSVRACGGCDNVCTAPVGALQVCVASQCGIECDPGLIRCGNQCAASCDSNIGIEGELSFEVPPECTRARIKAWGAGGGHGSRNSDGAAGGFAQGEIIAVPGERWTVVVGAPGRDATSPNPGLGGAPGGGNGGVANDDIGGGGGGYSGVFRGAKAPENAIVIAGGGGGSGGGQGDQVLGGAGGGTDGQNGGRNNALGGTQASGAAALSGGAGEDIATDGGGGGGGGWFGGLGGGDANDDGFGGGGGSGFVIAGAAMPLLMTGSLGTAGLAEDPDRMDAGNPGAPGRVIIDCLPAE